MAHETRVGVGGHWAVMLALAASAAGALAVDGPSVNAIPNADWGGPDDIWPHVVRLEIGTSYCTGTLIAPDMVATAGHCFGTPNAAIAPGTVTVDFGPGLGTMRNSGGRTHGVSRSDLTAGDFAVVTLDTSSTPTPVSPIALLPRTPRVGETSFAVGFGVEGGTQNADNADRIEASVGGWPQHAEAAKNWARITVDGLRIGAGDAYGYVQQFQASPENWTEPGDSGGPGIGIHSAIPGRAYGSAIGDYQRNDFVFSAVSGGPTPATRDSSDPTRITYPANPAARPDEWTSLEHEMPFIHANRSASMRPTNVSIYHNLPANPSLLAPDDIVKVLAYAAYDPNVPDYFLNLTLWEEDDETAGPFDFSGDIRLAPTAGADDLLGFGFSAGRFTGLENIVVVWEEIEAKYLLPYAEDSADDLSWLFQVNYGNPIMATDLTQNVAIFATDLATIDAEIARAMQDIDGGAALRGGFAMPAPEPHALALLASAVGFLTFGSRRRRWS
ncbi:MAG: S1 family peptidase [Chromatiales bacterium]|nr:S1 family peptidase [Chromatiales bacterium]